MEFVLRCNDLKCRTQLYERAVVTTCSHVFCTQCADTTGLSRSQDAQRICPACSAPLQNPDDVVVAGLNPSEDYKTSVLSGLSPAIIMECASRGLAFHSYQTSQEIVYQEYLAKGLTEKYNVLSQQMDKLIHDANSQIDCLTGKLRAVEEEQNTLKEKNHDLAQAFKEKAAALSRKNLQYNAMKQQMMASEVALAAGNEAELTTQSGRGQHFIERMPGARTNGGRSHAGVLHQPGRMRVHSRADSGSSGGSGHQSGGIPAPTYASHLQGRGLEGRVNTSQSASAVTPMHSRLPVMGGTRQGSVLNPGVGPRYQASPMLRQTPGLNGVPQGYGNLTLGAAKSSRRVGIPVQR